MVQNAGMTRVLLLLPTRTYRTADFLAAADRLGVDVVVGAERRNALESLADGGTMLVRLDDPDRGAAMVERYAREHPLDAVVGVDDGSTVVAATAAERLGLPHNPPDAVRRSRDKAQTRAAFAAAGLATPNFAVHSALLDVPAVSALAAATRYPCVLKPLERSGSQGVIRADNPADLVAAFGRIARILGCDVDAPGAASAGDGPQPQILIEDFLGPLPLEIELFAPVTPDEGSEFP